MSTGVVRRRSKKGRKQGKGSRADASTPHRFQLTWSRVQLLRTRQILAPGRDPQARTHPAGRQGRRGSRARARRSQRRGHWPGPLSATDAGWATDAGCATRSRTGRGRAPGRLGTCACREVPPKTRSPTKPRPATRPPVRPRPQRAPSSQAALLE